MLCGERHAAPERRRARFGAEGVALALLVAASLARVPTAGASAFINIVDAAVTLMPTPTDYDNDYVEATGAAGITLKVKTNSLAGMVLLVRSASTAPAIAIGDLLVRTMSAPGQGGTSLSTYTSLGPTNLTLWSTGVEQGPFILVDVDIRVRNLMNYVDASGAGFTYYTNTLIFTVFEQ